MMRSRNWGSRAPDDLRSNAPAALVPTILTDDEPLEEFDEFELFDIELKEDVFCDESIDLVVWGQRVGDNAPNLETDLPKL